MTIAGFFTLLAAFLKFPGELTSFIKLLQTTPEEQHADLVANIQKQLKSFEETGRPS